MGVFVKMTFDKYHLFQYNLSIEIIGLEEYMNSFLKRVYGG